MSNKDFTVSPYLIKRMGFEEFAFNILVNIKENGYLVDGYVHEQDNLIVTISENCKHYLVAIRCYIPDTGWQSVEFEYKNIK